MPGDRLPAAATAIAQQKDAGVVELSTMQMNLQKGTAEVFIDLYRRDDIKGWSFLFRASGRATSAEVDEGQIEQITGDPRIRQIQSIAQSLNVGANFGTAVAMGAVVAKAQDRARTQLEDMFAGGNADTLVVGRYELREEGPAQN